MSPHRVTLCPEGNDESDRFRPLGREGRYSGRGRKATCGHENVGRRSGHKHRGRAGRAAPSRPLLRSRGQSRYSAQTEHEAASGKTEFRRDQGALPILTDTTKNMKTPKSSIIRKPVLPAKKAASAKSPLVSSPAAAKQESARLRRGRASLESASGTAETDIRTTLI